MEAKGESFKACDFFKVGDVVVNTWGYEQTNVDFYQVTSVLNKKIRVRKIANKILDGMDSFGMACKVMPGIDEFVEDEDSRISLLTLKSCISRIGENACKICNPKKFYNFEKWDGTPVYESWYN